MVLIMNDRKGKYMIKLKYNITKWEESNTNVSIFDIQGKKISIFEEVGPYLKEQSPTALTVITSTDDTVGGLFLIKKPLSQTIEQIRNLLPLESGYIWECSILHFMHLPEFFTTLSSTEPFLRYFYHTLYEGLVEFAKQKQIGFVIIKLTADAYPPTQHLGLWPYIVQFLPKESSDPYFYGILPLKGKFYESYQTQWENFDKGSLNELITNKMRKEP